MKGPSNYIWLGTMRARLQGFVVFDYEASYIDARLNLSYTIMSKRKLKESLIIQTDTFVK